MSDESQDPDVERVLTAHARPLGGITIQRALPQAGCRAVGPFVFLDHAGPVDVPPGVDNDVRPHPHIGLSTISHLYEGEIVHRDSTGVVQTIRPGELNVMTAGAGIVHSERAPEMRRFAGGRAHGLQLWVALPAANEDDPPSFAHHARDALPSFERDGVRGRVLLGAAFGVVSPASTPSRPLLVELSMDAGARIDLPDEVDDVGVYVVDGELTRREGASARTHQLVVRRVGRSLALQARAPTRAVILGGAHLDGAPSRNPRHIEWNFVASTRERIEAAKRRWRAREFPTIQGDSEERIPLPDELA